MVRPLAELRAATDVLALVRAIPSGRVATADVLADCLGVTPKVVATLLSNLTQEERDGAPWHRVVAKGGAIGRGPHRDAQFAKLVREGVSVSPAGIVQDMQRVAMTALVPRKSGNAEPAAPDCVSPPAAPLGRSRGMKDRPS